MDVLEGGGNETFRKVLKETPHQMVGFKHFKRRAGEGKIFEDKRMTRLKNVNSPPIGLWAHWVVGHRYFEWFVLFVILMNAVVLGVQAELGEDEHEHWLTLQIMYYLDLFALYVFLLEIGLKWLDSFTRFWRSGWNIFDFLVTVLSAVPEVLPLFLSSSSSSSTDSRRFAVVAKQLRLLRVLRALKLLVHFTGIRIIVETTLQAFNSMSFIMILLGLVAYIYAVAGVYVFSEYTESGRTDLAFQEKFDGMGNALITLFQLMTLDQWYTIHQDVAKVIPVAITATYMLSWVFIGAFAFRNIFVGVMVKNFALASERMREEKAARKKKASIKRYFKKLKTYHAAVAKGGAKSGALGMGASHGNSGGGGGDDGLNRTTLGTSGDSDTSVLSDSEGGSDTEGGGGGGGGGGTHSASQKSMSSLNRSTATFDAIAKRVNSFLVRNREEGIGWESHIASNLSGLTAGDLETVWPRDTLFHYLQDMQTLQEVNREYQELQLLTSWVLSDAFDS